MKQLKTYAIALFTLATTTVFAQTDKATTKMMVESKNFIFVAQTANPMNAQDISAVLSKMPGANSSGSIQLTGGYYEVKVTPDSVNTFLPYYGRSYTAPIDRNEGGVKFNSKEFEYKSKAGRKRGWDIEIRPKDTDENYRLSLNVGEKGYATLSLTSNNKQSITYNGYLKELKKK